MFWTTFNVDAAAESLEQAYLILQAVKEWGQMIGGVLRIEGKMLQHYFLCSAAGVLRGENATPLASPWADAQKIERTGKKSQLAEAHGLRCVRKWGVESWRGARRCGPRFAQ
jgi:hypothetical protein